MIGGCPINRASRAGRIISDHSAERSARARCHVRAETKSVWLKKIVELIENNACSDAHAAFFQIEIGDLAIVPRKLDDQTFADRVSDKASACASRSDRQACIGRGPNDETRLLRIFRKRHAERLDLINRRVSGIKLPGQIIKPHVAPGLPDLAFLRGSHPNSLSSQVELLQRLPTCVEPR